MRARFTLSVLVIILVAGGSRLQAQFVTESFTGTLTHDPGFLPDETGGTTGNPVSGPIPEFGSGELSLDTFSTSEADDFSHANANASVHFSPTLTFIALDNLPDPAVPTLVSQIAAPEDSEVTGPATMTFTFSGTLGLGAHGAPKIEIFVGAKSTSGVIGLGDYVGYDCSATFSDAASIWGPPTTLSISYVNSTPGAFAAPPMSSLLEMPALPPSDIITITGSIVMTASDPGTSEISTEFDSSIPIPEPSILSLLIGAAGILMPRRSSQIGRSTPTSPDCSLK